MMRGFTRPLDRSVYYRSRGLAGTARQSRASPVSCRLRARDRTGDDPRDPPAGRRSVGRLAGSPGRRRPNSPCRFDPGRNAAWDPPPDAAGGDRAKEGLSESRGLLAENVEMRRVGERVGFTMRGPDGECRAEIRSEPPPRTPGGEGGPVMKRGGFDKKCGVASWYLHHRAVRPRWHWSISLMNLAFLDRPASARDACWEIAAFKSASATGDLFRQNLKARTPCLLARRYMGGANWCRTTSWMR